MPVDVHAVPVSFQGRVITVVEQHTSRLGVRAPSTLKSAYLESADEGRQHLLAPEDRRLADLELSGADRGAVAQCAEFGQ